MNRRDALKSVMVMMGKVTIGRCDGYFDRFCAPDTKSEGPKLQSWDIAFLDELGDKIIPEPDTPGAKATGMGPLWWWWF